MKRLGFILLLMLVLGHLSAQDSVQLRVNQMTEKAQQKVMAEAEYDSLKAVAWKPDPMKAVWMGAIIPGYGQIYNRSYWKLPIVYGAFMGCIYAITVNNTSYTDYKQAYRDIATDLEISPDPSRSYNAVLPKGYTVDMMGGKDAYTTYLQKQQNSYRRYRDLSIVGTVVVYALSLIDAYVDAQLFDFDISTDLSMNVSPQLQQDLLHNRSAELHLAIKF